MKWIFSSLPRSCAFNTQKVRHNAFFVTHIRRSSSLTAPCVIMHFEHIHAIFTSLLMAVYAFVKKCEKENEKFTRHGCHKKLIQKISLHEHKCTAEVWSRKNFSSPWETCIFHVYKKGRKKLQSSFSSHNISPTQPSHTFSLSSSSSSPRHRPSFVWKFLMYVEALKWIVMSSCGHSSSLLSPFHEDSFEN